MSGTPSTSKIILAQPGNYEEISVFKTFETCSKSLQEKIKNMERRSLSASWKKEQLPKTSYDITSEDLKKKMNTVQKRQRMELSDSTRVDDSVAIVQLLEVREEFYSSVLAFRKAPTPDIQKCLIKRIREKEVLYKKMIKEFDRKKSSWFHSLEAKQVDTTVKEYFRKQLDTYFDLLLMHLPWMKSKRRKLEQSLMKQTAPTTQIVHDFPGKSLPVLEDLVSLENETFVDIQDPAVTEPSQQIFQNFKPEHKSGTELPNQESISEFVNSTIATLESIDRPTAQPNSQDDSLSPSGQQSTRDQDDFNELLDSIFDMLKSTDKPRICTQDDSQKCSGQQSTTNQFQHNEPSTSRGCETSTMFSRQNTKQQAPEDYEHLKCRACSKTFLKKDIKQHELSHKNTFLKCGTCGELFLCQYDVKEHSISHIISEELRKKCCKVCFTAFGDTLRLHNHLRLYHHMLENRKPTDFECFLCYDTFLSSSLLVKHIRHRHENHSLITRAVKQPRRGFTKCECWHCHINCNSVKQLTLHILMVHGAAPYRCQCKATFYSKGVYDSHVLKHKLRKIQKKL